MIETLNIRFKTLAKARNVADAIAEAKRLAQHAEGDWPIEVEAGKQSFKVFKDGQVTLNAKRGETA